MNAGKDYAQRRIDALAQAISATDLSIAYISRKSGVSREVVRRATRGEGIQAYNFFKLENFIQNEYQN